ncbi:MAG: cytochrome P450 [Microthrixaceae bacterium]
MTVRLGDPDTFVDGVPHEEIARLRRAAPLSWQPLSNPDDPDDGFWAVLRHADVVRVARDPECFSASTGGIVVETLDDETLGMVRAMLLAMDPPRHGLYRKPLAETFTRRVIASLEPEIRALCREILDERVTIPARRGDGRIDVDFVSGVAAEVPTRVMGRLMGVPREDWALLHELSRRQTSGQDPDVTPPGQPPDFSASVEMALYGIELATRRRARWASGAAPEPDLTTLVLSADFDGEPMSDVDFGSFFVQLVTAGNDTTTTMLSSGLWALMAHPDAMSAMRGDVSTIPGAIEEILRWANPLHYFRRTATRDVVVGDPDGDGVEVKAGEKVAMYYTSANRDDTVFDDPDRFDISRSPNPHLSFGIGEHFCLGAHLARMEGRVFFETLFEHTSRIEPSGAPVHLRSNLNNAWKSVPVTIDVT